MSLIYQKLGISETEHEFITSFCLQRGVSEEQAETIMTRLSKLVAEAIAYESPPRRWFDANGILILRPCGQQRRLLYVLFEVIEVIKPMSIWSKIRTTQAVFGARAGHAFLALVV